MKASLKAKFPCFFFALTNSVGGFEQIAPDAQLDDGLFTLILVKTANLFKMIRLIGLVLNGGKHIDDKKIEYIKTSQIKIEPQSGVIKWWSILMANTVAMRQLPWLIFKNHIEMYANLDEISDENYTGDEEDLELEAVVSKFSERAEKTHEINE